jgi:hypothetical protein
MRTNNLVHLMDKHPRKSLSNRLFTASPPAKTLSGIVAAKTRSNVESLQNAEMNSSTTEQTK